MDGGLMERPTTRERVAVVEAKMQMLIDKNSLYHEALNKHMEAETEQFKNLKVCVDKINGKLNRYGGIVTGVAMAVSALWAGLIAVWEWFKG